MDRLSRFLMLPILVPFIAGCQREPEHRKAGREHRDPANGHPRRAVVPARSGNQLRLDNFLRYPSCRTNGRSHHRPRFQVLGQKIQFWATFLGWAKSSLQFKLHCWYPLLSVLNSLGKKYRFGKASHLPRLENLALTQCSSAIQSSSLSISKGANACWLRCCKNEDKPNGHIDFGIHREITHNLPMRCMTR